MALVVVGSAKGSPGATTTALTLAALWPRAVLLAECDPAGGDVALRLRSPAGSPLDPGIGLVSLAAAARRGLEPGAVHRHSQSAAGGLDVLVGLRSAEQAAGLEGLWPALGQALASWEAAPVDGRVEPGDVVADVGRIRPDGPAAAFLRLASLVVLVCRPSVASLFHLRERLAGLAAPVRPGLPQARIGVVVLAEPGQAREVRSVREMLAVQPRPPDAVWHLAWDPRGARTFDGNPPPRPARTDLIRSATPIALAAAGMVAGAPADRPEAKQAMP